MGKKLYWAMGVVAAMMALLYMLSASTEVETITVGKGNIQHTVIDTGYVQAAQHYDLYAEQGARVSNISVSLGQDIQKGQVLVVLENLDTSMSSKQLAISLNQAKSAITVAQAAAARSSLDLRDAEDKLARAQELYAAGAISKTEFDEASSLVENKRNNFQEQSASVKTAQSQFNTYQELLTQAQQKEAQLMVKSPIDGTLMQLPVQQEQVVQAGTLLARVALASKLEIKADLLSDDLGEVKLGQKVQVTAPVLGDAVLTGEIIKIYPQAEEKQSALGVIQRRVPVIIAMESTGNLKPGYETRVSIVTLNREDVLLVPRGAVRSNNNKQRQVMLINNGRVTLRDVKTGLMDSNSIEVIEGLQPGDQIIKDASTILKENSRVKEKRV